jgi:2-iminobutanoate/2-iminopropanoate deaminase
LYGKRLPCTRIACIIARVARAGDARRQMATSGRVQIQMTDNGLIEFIGQPGEGEARPFSRATKAGGLVFVSGHSGGIHGTATEETRAALNTVKGILEEAGSSLERVVQMTLLITNSADYHEINAEYVKHFPNGLPARHTARFGVPTQAKCGFACIALAE